MKNYERGALLGHQKRIFLQGEAEHRQNRLATTKFKITPHKKSLSY